MVYFIGFVQVKEEFDTGDIKEEPIEDEIEIDDSAYWARKQETFNYINGVEIEQNEEVVLGSSEIPDSVGALQNTGHSVDCASAIRGCFNRDDECLENSEPPPIEHIVVKPEFNFSVIGAADSSEYSSPPIDQEACQSDPLAVDPTETRTENTSEDVKSGISNTPDGVVAARNPGPSLNSHSERTVFGRPIAK